MTSSPSSEPTATQPPARPGLLLIDASEEPASWILWGMTLAERQRRQASLAGIDRIVVWVNPTAAQATRWRADLQRLHPQHCDLVETALQLNEIILEHGADGLLVADGDVLHDDRILDHLLQQGPGHAIVSQESALAWLSKADWSERGTDWPDGGASRLAEGLACTDLARIGDYVPELRLTIAPYMVRLTDPGQLRQVDHLMYRRTFKGVIDAIARYGYYYLVRFITRILSRTTLSPNLFTALSILGIWIAIPCFATGHIALGCASAWIGVLLDSVDGKLARLTLNLSDAMGTIEHLSAMPGLGLWFVAIGWHLTSGDLITVSTPMLACWATVITFLVDKLVSGAFRQHFGRELFDVRPLDACFHLFAVRRNMHLLILTIGGMVQAVDTAFLVMAAGMVGTLLMHVGRFAWIAATGGVPDTEAR